MPRLICTHCGKKLRVPEDNVPRKVKCSSCRNTFYSAQAEVVPDRAAAAAAPSGEYEVIEEAPAPPPKRASDAFDFGDDPVEVEEYDESPRRRKGGHRDADRDPPRRRRYDRYEEDNGRDHEDDYDDHEDDDDYDRPPRRGRDYGRKKPAKKGHISKAEYGHAKTAMTLLLIGNALYVAVYVLAAIFVMLGWAGVDGTGLTFLPGLAGMGNWIMSAVGLGFLLAGPKKGACFGLALTAGLIALAHIGCLVAIIAERADSMSQIWNVATGQLPILPLLLTSDSDLSRLIGGGLDTLDVVAALMELARFVVIMATVRNLGAEMKDNESKSFATVGMIAVGCAVVAAAVIIYIAGAVSRGDLKTARYAMPIAGIMMFVILGGSLALGIPATKSAADRADYKS